MRKRSGRRSPRFWFFTRSRISSRRLESGEVRGVKRFGRGEGDGRYRGFTAHRVAKTEKDRTQGDKGKEDDKDHRRAERDLPVTPVGQIIGTIFTISMQQCVHLPGPCRQPASSLSLEVEEKPEGRFRRERTLMISKVVGLKIWSKIEGLTERQPSPEVRVDDSGLSADVVIVRCACLG